ncbi:hypothetical protein HDF24_09755 [Mucilaginibacter sp. X4EP1]|uniref:hypothetical protein n=1 Tax=Mucilaginibacter sp. X4EP1 TaxID=2723092 RepID=UPI002168A7CD|nr:hypothetical protein [Mucilaginibacter sp. X4EP1]MCS3816587.1 hypothetical protein [Mucilaginibacter sp. X4EP1]
MSKKKLISLYWKCQLIGWSVASLYWSYLGFSGGKFNLPVGVLQFISGVVVYILYTHKNPFAQVNYGTRKNVSTETMADGKVPLKIAWSDSS